MGKHLIGTLSFLLLLAGSPVLAAPPAPSALDSPRVDVLAEARKLAFAGKRADALKLLAARLESRPGDTDARTFYGIILSWEGRYDEARAALQTVLEGNRLHGDALPALINVELWSGHPERAEGLCREALRLRPNNTVWMLAHARSLRALSRPREASLVLRRLLELDPRNSDAVQLQGAMSESQRRWETSIGHSVEWFNDKRANWHESQAQLRYQSAIGSFITRFSQARRFGFDSRQIDMDAYPRFRPGTYAYLNFGMSPDRVLYPRYRAGAEIFQSLGGGWEASGGFRRLGFSSPVMIYTGSLTKYYGNWMITGRAITTPGSTGTSRSFQGTVRYYYGGGISYFGGRYLRGSYPVEARSLQDIEVLAADSAAVEWNHRFGRRWILNLQGGTSHEDRLSRLGLRRYSVSAALYFNF